MQAVIARARAGQRACSSRSVLSVAACLAGMLATASPAGALERRATPSSFASVVAAAQGGDTVLLAAGDYGTFTGASKASVVTIKPEPGVTASMRVNFTSASNLRLEGLTIGGIELGGSTRNITIAKSRVTSHTIIRTASFNNSNVVLDGNTHADINACGSCYEGRITLPGQGSNPSGVTIRNSLFRGGNADGIQNGSRGTSIIGNEFVDIYESGGIHTDAIQLYGSSQTLVRGNWIHRTSSGIMAPDGADREIIEHNVIDPGGYPFAITLYSDNGSIVRHNTLPDGACAFNLRCGIITLGSKSGTPAGRGTIVTDNVLGEVTVGGGSATTTNKNYNLIANGGLSGPQDLRGKPTYTGGSTPTTYAGFTLTTNSLGTGTGTSGTNRGINTSSTPTPPTLASIGTPAPSATPAPTATLAAPVAAPTATAPARDGREPTMKVARTIRWGQLMRGLPLRLAGAKAQTRASIELTRPGSRRLVADRRIALADGGRTVVLRLRPGAMGRRRAMRVLLTVTLTDGAGAATRLRSTIRVRR